MTKQAVTPLVLIASICLLFAACEDSSQIASQSSPLVETASTAIPGDVIFTVVTEDSIPGIKRSLDVRINKRVSEDVLRAIALELHGRSPQKYERTFMIYLLPEMHEGDSAWATTHFNPDLEVRVLGLTPMEANALSAEPIARGGSMIGRWADERIGGVIEIRDEGGQLHFEERFKDGSKRQKVLLEKKVTAGRQFTEAQAEYGEFWLLLPDGRLQLGDDDGIMATFKKL